MLGNSPGVSVTGTAAGVASEEVELKRMAAGPMMEGDAHLEALPEDPKDNWVCRLVMRTRCDRKVDICRDQSVPDACSGSKWNNIPIAKTVKK